jgi:putative endonuclease
MQLQFYVYILICSDGSYYVGHCRDVDHRVRLHNAGQGAKHTRDHCPVTLAYTEAFST